MEKWEEEGERIKWDEKKNLILSLNNTNEAEVVRGMSGHVWKKTKNKEEEEEEEEEEEKKD